MNIDFDPAALVRAQLAAAGISPREEEVAVFIAEAPGRRADIEALYAVEGARYEEPGLVFSALP